MLGDELNIAQRQEYVDCRHRADLRGRMEPVRVRFQDCVVDFATVEIWREGTLVDVQPQVFAVVEHLITHRDRVVTKEELLDNIWGDRFVGESALTTRIKTARKVLGDDGQRQATIKTVHGRGYRFVADVIEEAGSADDGPDSAEAATGEANAPGTDRGTPTPADRALPLAFQIPPPDAEWPFVGRHVDLATVEWAYTQGLAGVAIRGSDRVGKSRFGAECLRLLANSQTTNSQTTKSQTTTLAVRGLSSTRDIPLSALIGLLPEDIVRSEHQADDLARADVFRRSYEAFLSVLDPGLPRPAILIDDFDMLDSMSAAVLTTAIAEGHVFGVMVQPSRRPDGDDPVDDQAFNDLVSSDRFLTVTLGNLTEVDLDVLLYRALCGPIEQVTLDRLGDASGHNPGLLRDIVEASRNAGSLLKSDGVWQLVGPISSSQSRGWPPADLPADAQDAADRLALLGPVNLDVATKAVDEGALDILDEAGLLRTVDHPDGPPIVTLADPILMEAVRDAIPALRARRLKTDLAERLLGLGDPAVLARLVDWGSGFSDDLDSDQMVGAAFAALLADDMETADRLASSVDPALHPAAAVVLGEVALKRGQWERAEEELSAVDQQQLDPFLASLAIRRLATIRFNQHGEYREAVEQLAEEESRHDDGVIARAIGARRMSLLTLSGRYLEVLEEVPKLTGGHGVTHLEILISTAGAELGAGQMTGALQRCRMAHLMLNDVVPAPWRAESQDAIASTECSAHLQAGNIKRAAEEVHNHLTYGVRSALGILPVKAAEIEIEAGRPRAARTILESTLDGSSRNEFPQFIGLADTLTSRIDLALSRPEAAAAGIDPAMAALDEAPPVMRWRIAVWLCELLVAADRAGEAVDLLVELADEATACGAPEPEVDLLLGAMAADPGPKTAKRVIKRIEKASAFEGKLWPLRVDHARARAADDLQALEQVAARYRSLGYVRLAEQAERAQVTR